MKGTIEFRGGRHVRTGEKTKRWIAFTVAFIEMALSQVMSAMVTLNGADSY